MKISSRRLSTLCLILSAGLCSLHAGENAVPEAAPPTGENIFLQWWEGDYGTGNWGGVRTALEDNGLEIGIVSVNEGWYNLSGGLETGGNLTGYWEWGFQWDFEPLTGWKGASVVVDGNWYYGGQPSEKLVGIYPAMNISSYESSNALRMYHIYFQQTWGRNLDGDDDSGASPVRQEDQQGSYLFKIGQFAADDDFMGTEYGSVFINASFGQYPKEAEATAAPAYRLAAPGVFFSAQPIEEWFIRVAAFTANAGEDIVSNNGFEWRWGGATGFATFVETGVNVEIAGLPGTYTVGGFYDTSDFENFDGTAVESGNWNVWFTLDQALVMQENGDDPLLGIFFRAVPGPANNRNPINWGLDGGVVLFGEPWGRPDDQFAVGLATANFASEFVVAEGLTTRDQTILEFTYLLQANKWLSVQPNLQVIFDPAFAQEDAVVIGLRVAAEL